MQGRLCPGLPVWSRRHQGRLAHSAPGDSGPAAHLVRHLPEAPPLSGPASLVPTRVTGTLASAGEGLRDRGLHGDGSQAGCVWDNGTGRAIKGHEEEPTVVQTDKKWKETSGRDLGVQAACSSHAHLCQGGNPSGHEGREAPLTICAPVP